MKIRIEILTDIEENVFKGEYYSIEDMELHINQMENAIEEWDDMKAREIEELGQDNINRIKQMRGDYENNEIDSSEENK